MPSCASGRTGNCLLRYVRHVLDLAIAILAPAECRICNEPLIRASAAPVCDRCIASLTRSRLSPGCRLCSEPLGFEPLETTTEDLAGLCRQCVGKRPRFIRATAWGDYEDLRPLVHLLKFDGITGLAPSLGRLLAHAVLELREGAPDEMVVVPVPLYRGKRQFNQSMLLAQGALLEIRKIAPGWSLQLRPGLLRRTAYTQSQYALSPAQRRDNVRNAFAASLEVAGKHVVLIDDVYTTGATAAECTRVLMKAGAASVRVATLARAVRDGAVRWQPAVLNRDGVPEGAGPAPLFSTGNA